MKKESIENTTLTKKIRWNIKWTHCRRGHEFTEKTTRIHKSGYRTCKICSDLKDKEWIKNNPLLIRAHTYKMPLAELKSLLDKQKGLCKICERPYEDKFQIDHDHKTGRVRGLLCRACNIGLGLFNDRKEILERAIKYFEKEDEDEKQFRKYGVRGIEDDN